MENVKLWLIFQEYEDNNNRFNMGDYSLGRKRV
jgi:hypothetical protein